jgi:hypothetical protein
MSFFFETNPFDPANKHPRSKGVVQATRRLLDVGDFFRRLRVQMRFGELTRAPLQLVSFQVVDKAADCNWIARPPDKWDAHLPRGIGQQHASLQAIRDAMDIRELLFATLPDIDSARLRVYRQPRRGGLELVITGSVDRADRPARNIRSLAMRANLLGFRFSLENGILEKYPDDTLRAGA